jgi:hypothetical protein
VGLDGAGVRLEEIPGFWGLTGRGRERCSCGLFRGRGRYVFGGRVVQYGPGRQRVAIWDGIKEYLDDLEYAIELHIAECCGRGKRGSLGGGQRPVGPVAGPIQTVPIAGAAVGDELENVEFGEQHMRRVGKDALVVTNELLEQSEEAVEDGADGGGADLDEGGASDGGDVVLGEVLG